MLIIYTLDQEDCWNNIVRSFKSYDTYWLSGYVKAFKIQGDGEPLLFFYDDNKGTRAINVVMKRDIANDKNFNGKIPEETYFDFSTPYGYGGWIIEGEDIELLFKSYNQWCIQNKIISEFVRFHPIIKNHKILENYYEIVQLGEVVHMDLSSPEVIWMNLSSKNRNMIRKAIKNNVKIYNGRYPEIYEIFRKIYNSTMDNNCADEYYYFSKEFYTSILEDLPQNAQIFYAEKDEKIIAASIILTTNKMMSYHLSGSLQEYKCLAPTSLLLYKAALYGFENDYKTFYLGGGIGSGEDSLFKFKRAFYRKRLNNFYIGKKIINQDVYNRLIKIQGKLLKTDFFPAYRN